MKLLSNSQKNDMIDEAQTLIKTIKQMEMSLEDDKNMQYDQHTGDLQITFPLNRCLVFLKEKYTAISKLHRERFEQVKSKLSYTDRLCFLIPC